MVALDLPGHGLSDKRGHADTYTAQSHATAVMEALLALKWSSVLLCSHSMGAGVSSMVAGALGSGAGPASSAVTGLIALEGLGMNTKQDNSSASALFTAVAARRKLLHKSGGKSYPSLAAAAAARMSTVAKYPGYQSLSRFAAEQLVSRGTVAHADGSVSFRHDVRLMEPSALYMTDSQMRAYLHAVTAPTLVVTASRGWPWPSQMMLGRLSSLSDLTHHHILGGHHCHLDDATGPTVAAIVQDFLTVRAADIDRRIEASKAARAQVQAHANPVYTQAHAPSSGSGAGHDEDAAAAAKDLATNDNDAAASGGRHSHKQPAVKYTTWSDRHIFIATTRPGVPPVHTLASGSAAPTAAASAAAAGKTETRQHLYPYHLHIEKSVSASELQARQAAFPDPPPVGGGAPAPPLMLDGAPQEHVWVHTPDSLSGVPTRSINAALHKTADAHLSVGAWVPRVYVATVPTLEGVTAAAAAAAAGGAGGAAAGAAGASRDAQAAAAQALAARGDAY